MLKRWHKNEYINKQQFYFLKSSDLPIPKAYGVPKIHKKDHPLRVIVSSINSPLYRIANYIHKILKESLPEPRSHINNSFHLYNVLSNMDIDNSHVLVSLDVVSLFNNTPIDLAMQGIMNRWSYICKRTNIPRDEFLNAIKFILESSYFVYNNIYYKQTFGTPMGSPLSPIVADIVLQDIENKALHKINKKLQFYYRYVDDILLAAQPNDINTILQLFNSFHDRIRFTLEYGDAQGLSFLDLKLKIIDNHLNIDWFHKDSFSGRCLSFHSNHPLNHKIGTIYSLIDRAILLSDPSHHSKNLELCVKILIDNGYPLEYIFKHANIRIKKLCMTKLNHNYTPPVEKMTQKKFIGFPYIKDLSEHLRKTFKDTTLLPGYRCFNKLNRYIKLHKDPTPTMHDNNIIYKICCNDCDASYVGQTKRQLNTRINEHIKNIKQTSNLSVISQHTIDHNHTFNWKNASILDHENNYYKRLISETIHIKQQNNGLNFNEDTELLDKSYFPLLTKLKNKNKKQTSVTL